jgi:ABC-2 type transport system ATP-binding protein
MQHHAPMPTTADALAIDLRDVAKRYRGRIDALKGIEMHVRGGEVFGLLGPNGAGKTTLVKIMMTIVRANRAAGTVLGHPIGDKATLGRIGYLPENHRFPRYLTGRQIVEFFGALAKVDRPTRKKRAAELIDLVGMSDAADRKVSTYSKGMAQRIGLAQALVNDPDLVLLDEPTDGVDPVGRRDIRDVLVRLRARGKTVFINSHMLSELEMICDRVAILVAGRVAKQGTIGDLTAARQRFEIEVGVNGMMPSLKQVVGARWDEANVELGGQSGQAKMSVPPIPLGVRVERGELSNGRWVEVSGPVVRVGTTDANEVQGVIDSLRTAGMVVQRVGVVRPSLEELFMEAVRGEGQGGGR